MLFSAIVAASLPMSHSSRSANLQAGSTEVIYEAPKHKLCCQCIGDGCSIIDRANNAVNLPDGFLCTEQPRSSLFGASKTCSGADKAVGMDYYAHRYYFQPLPAISFDDDDDDDEDHPLPSDTPKFMEVEEKGMATVESNQCQNAPPCDDLDFYKKALAQQAGMADTEEWAQILEALSKSVPKGQVASVKPEFLVKGSA
eukprot:TRINITY_DN18534_c0_g1_i1.p1 TRINITY_DN18534_c0_g1~~TRINITY_DN18534_c0_g1_i1.p1  ORF type:complete len:227 (-),score=37.66 TRINITY_DN18534_c0_g1_i1:28-624(-)